MIVYRALQGFIGGGMIPTVFASAFTIFPPEKRPVISPIIGLVATLAPTIGPTLGGYLTDLFSWHWLFLVNIVPGIFVTVSTYLLVDFDEPDFSLFKTFDWAGLGFMAAFLGSLEYVLEEGPLNDWFQDEAVLILTDRLRRRRHRLLLPRVQRPSSRSWTCAPSPTATSSRAPPSASSWASASTD